MEKFIPYEKLSKKKKRELDAGKRTVWAVSPVTRKSENPKAYNRKKAQKRMDAPGSVLSLLFPKKRDEDSLPSYKWIVSACGRCVLGFRADPANDAVFAAAQERDAGSCGAARRASAPGAV